MECVLSNGYFSTPRTGPASKQLGFWSCTTLSVLCACSVRGRAPAPINLIYVMVESAEFRWMTRRGVSSWSWLYRWFWAAMWVLETKLVASERVLLANGPSLQPRHFCLMTLMSSLPCLHSLLLTRLHTFHTLLLCVFSFFSFGVSRHGFSVYPCWLDSY